MKFWKMEKKADDVGELLLYGIISNETWFGDEVTPKQFKNELDELGDINVLNVYINSDGGDVFAGQAIYSMLKRHKAKVNVYIDGLAASIASVVAMAGDVVYMPENAMMMVHKAWSMMVGTADDFRKMADDMEKIEESIVAVYTAKTGMNADEIKSIMSAETWLSAKDAKEFGFIDVIEAEKKIAAMIRDDKLFINDQLMHLERYKNPPKQLLLLSFEKKKDALIEKNEPGIEPDNDRLYLFQKKLELQSKKWRLEE